MQTRLIELHQQRGRILERIAAQRRLLSQQLVPLQGVFSFRSRVSGALQDGKDFARRHPVGIAVAVLALALLKPRTVLRWTQRGLVAWKTWRSVSGWVPGFLLQKLRSLVR